ncbi:unnamed protein product [Effrenium voratum]|uniref:Uncharacterized protein n=1 Tax=Effrenium voratum TaxID=2562239 RepID=A0AA36JBD0_9DINO|nr:unnamed protein product [Effrenium voratum]CAJ1418095.1 unnamed protein product [Effrenium voratum]
MNVLSHSEEDWADPRYRATGVFAPSQFAATGLHDFWFAGASASLDAFAAWGEQREALLPRFGLLSEEIPVDVGHFYTYLHAKQLGLRLAFTGISYLDYTLVRYKDCKLQVGEEIQPPDIFCSHWEISIMRQCQSWLPKPHGWARGLCPVAGRRALLAPGSRSCGRF